MREYKRVLVGCKVSLSCCVCVYAWVLIVHVHVSVGMPCMEMGVCQEYCMRAVSGEFGEFVDCMS